MKNRSLKNKTRKTKGGFKYDKQKSKASRKSASIVLKNRHRAHSKSSKQSRKSTDIHRTQ